MTHFFHWTQFHLPTPGTSGSARLLCLAAPGDQRFFNGFFLQAFLSKTIDTPALDLPPLGDEVREQFHQLFILQIIVRQFRHIFFIPRRTSMRRSWPLTQTAGSKNIHIFTFKHHLFIRWNLAGRRNSVLVPIRSQSLSDWFCSLSIMFDWIKEKLLHKVMICIHLSTNLHSSSKLYFWPVLFIVLDMFPIFSPILSFVIPFWYIFSKLASTMTCSYGREIKHEKESPMPLLPFR